MNTVFTKEELVAEIKEKDSIRLKRFKRILKRVLQGEEGIDAFNTLKRLSTWALQKEVTQEDVKDKFVSWMDIPEVWKKLLYVNMDKRYLLFDHKRYFFTSDLKFHWDDTYDEYEYRVELWTHRDPDRDKDTVIEEVTEEMEENPWLESCFVSYGNNRCQHQYEFNGKYKEDNEIDE